MSLKWRMHRRRRRQSLLSEQLARISQVGCYAQQQQRHHHQQQAAHHGAVALGLVQLVQGTCMGGQRVCCKGDERGVVQPDERDARQAQGHGTAATICTGRTGLRAWCSGCKQRVAGREWEGCNQAPRPNGAHAKDGDWFPGLVIPAFAVQCSPCSKLMQHAAAQWGLQANGGSPSMHHDSYALCCAATSQPSCFHTPGCASSSRMALRLTSSSRKAMTALGSHTPCRGTVEHGWLMQLQSEGHCCTVTAALQCDGPSMVAQLFWPHVTVKQVQCSVMAAHLRLSCLDQLHLVSRLARQLAPGAGTAGGRGKLMRWQAQRTGQCMQRSPHWRLGQVASMPTRPGCNVRGLARMQGRRGVVPSVQRAAVHGPREGACCGPLIAGALAVSGCIGAGHQGINRRGSGPPISASTLAGTRLREGPLNPRARRMPHRLLPARCAQCRANVGNAAGAATKACASRAGSAAPAGPLFNQCLPAHPAHRYCEKDWNWYTNSSTMSHSHRLGSIMFRLLFRMTAGERLGERGWKRQT